MTDYYPLYKKISKIIYNIIQNQFYSYIILNKILFYLRCYSTLNMKKLIIFSSGHFDCRMLNSFYENLIKILYIIQSVSKALLKNKRAHCTYEEKQYFLWNPGPHFTLSSRKI